MKDLTQDSIVRNLIALSVPMAAGMVFQTLYLLVDLYFVAGLGDAAVAGVGAAGTLAFAIMAASYVLRVGAVALISQATGGNAREDANVVFNQTLSLATLAAAAILLVGYVGAARTYLDSIVADPAARSEGLTYLHWFLPGLALQLPLAAMASGLLGTGVVRPAVVAETTAVLLNIVLTPVLVAGWGGGPALGVAGAGVASSTSIAVGAAMLALHVANREKYFHVRLELWRPRLRVWQRILTVGLPAGGEYALTFVYLTVMYRLASDFGAAAQGGFGIGSRILQALVLPAMAIALAATPIAGQNLGAGRVARVRETFAKTALLGSLAMLPLISLLQWRPDLPVRVFTDEAELLATGSTFLRIVSLNLIAQAVVLACSGTFQGLGITKLALLSSALRLTVFVPFAFIVAARSDARLEDVWYLSVATVWMQAGVSYALLQRQFRRRQTLKAVYPLDQPR